MSAMPDGARTGLVLGLVVAPVFERTLGDHRVGRTQAAARRKGRNVTGGADANLFVDHSQIAQSESLRSGI
jgi:hypothetical protein